MARPQVADGGDGLQMWRIASNILNKQHRTADRGWSSSLGVGRVLAIPHHKTLTCYETYHTAPDHSLVKLHKHRKIYMRFGTWNVRSLYRIGSLKTAAGELGKYTLDLVCVQEVRWEKGGTVKADHTFLYGQGNGDYQLVTGFFVQKRIVSASRRVEIISDRMTYIILGARWCYIIVLNVRAPCEDKEDDVKDSFSEELGRVFDQFPRYMKILLGDFNAKVVRENNFKLTIGNEGLQEICNKNGVRVVNIATSKSLVVKSTMFASQNS
jgi:hypothetical protein